MAGREVNPEQKSPKWNSTTKLIVGLTLVSIVGVLVFSFRSLIGPLLLAFILTYLLHPLAARLSTLTHLSWRAAVNLIFAILVLLLLGSSTATGVAVVQQVQSLIRLVEVLITDLPNLIDTLSSQVYWIGPFQFDLSEASNLTWLSDQITKAVQPMVGRVGTLVGTLASSAAATVGWGLFVLLVSYFVLADIGRLPDLRDYITIPGYDADLRRMAAEMGRIWNSFLRGQLIIVVMVIGVYSVVLTALGVRYAVALALLTGVARFVPYIGPVVNWTVLGLVTFFQSSNYFGLEAWLFTLVVVVVALIIDQIFDNLVSPRIMGQSLGVHPAAVLVAAIIAANLIGLVGVVVAAPGVATLKLIGGYVIRKLFDLDPWPERQEVARPIEFPLLGKLWRRLRAWWRRRQR